MKHTKVFVMTKEAALKNPRYVVSVGGTRSGKTFAILQLLTYLVERDKPGEVTSVVSETLPHLKKGAIRDFEAIIGTTLKDDANWNETEHIYTFPQGGKLEFFSVDAPSRVQGPARKRLFENEAIHLQYDTHRQLAVRTKGIIFIDLNPECVSWIDEKIMPRKNCITFRTTYKDNVDRNTGESLLTPEQIDEIESNKDDSNWWRVYGLGLTGQLEGLIFPEFEQVDSWPDVIADSVKESYGIDYGFTNDTTAIIHCLTDNRKREIWLDEVIFRKGMLNEDIVAVLKEEGVRAPIYADSAEPKTNADISRYGFNVTGSYKATKKAEQLQLIKGYKLKVTKRSLNVIRELRGYVWQKDKNGDLLNEPIGVQDHSMDAFRYGVFPYLENQAKGKYCFR